MGKLRKKTKRISSFNEHNFHERSTDYSMLLKELSCLSKKNGLVVGTNAVLRLLEKKCLAVVFLFSKSASSPIYHSLFLWCQSTDTKFILLKENDKYVLGPNFPKSITYGIQKKSLDSLPSISILLKKFKTFKRINTKDPEELEQVNISVDLESKSMEQASSESNEDGKPENEHLESVGPSESWKNYHHENHSKISKTSIHSFESGFLGLTQLDFPQYDEQSNPVKVRHLVKKKRKKMNH